MSDDIRDHRRETLFETEHGRVTRCGCCGALELRFGNALMALSVEELGPVLLSALAEADVAPAPEVTLHLGETGCGWVFDRAEAAEMHRLAAGARLMLDLADAA